MNLHLVDDEKFIDGAIELFEKYSPNGNIFLVNSAVDKLRYIKKIDDVKLLSFSAPSIKKDIEKIVTDNNVDKVYIHFLDQNKAAVVNHLKNKFNLKTYWIFFGADLYDLLHQYYNYPLHDIKIKNKVSLYFRLKIQLAKIKWFYKFGNFPEVGVSKCIENLDYFCFWNHFDYELLLKYYKTKAKFLYFVYFNAVEKDSVLIENTKGVEVVINHSGSLNGNHQTLLKKINRIDSERAIDKIIAPLSYGDPLVIDTTIRSGEKIFKERFFPILNFLDRTAYFNLFQNVTVAFYGARRQEAGGNVFSFLSKGVKVFLRNDNNMLQFLREKGFVVFSFEDDFNTIDDLKTLTNEEKQLNWSTYRQMFSSETEKEVMNLFLAT